MGCGTLTCTIDQILAGVACDRDGSLVDPDQLEGEQLVYDLAYKDLINNFGLTINYYVNGFNLSAADTLYGEHTTQEFYGPVTIRSYMELNEANLALAKFGFDPQDDLTAYFHITTFISTFSSLSVYTANGQVAEPKSGDLIELLPLGCDRPFGRSAKIFEITERLDQDVSDINPLLGHYVYRVRAKRYMHQFETNAPSEDANEQVYENSFTGKLSSTLFPSLTTSEEKSYPGNVDDDSQTDVYDQDTNPTSVYGSYY
jgi:hypothetical protein